MNTLLNTEFTQQALQVSILFNIVKAEKKGRTKVEVDEVILLLTGYIQAKLENQIEKQLDFETFFEEAPQLNPLCELAKGKSMEKILRK